MKRYIIHDLQGYNFMGYSHEEPLTADEIRQIRWQDYNDNIAADDDTLSYDDFTLEFIADLWEIEFEAV